MKVAAYCRIATAAQLDGIESQKRQIEKYCSDNDMEITDWYIDRGVSGLSMNRPSLEKLLKDATELPVGAVVIQSVDRLARDIQLYFEYVDEFEKRGIKLVSTIGNTDKILELHEKMQDVYKTLIEEGEKE
ncbi:MAG: recombinase family protein [Candidatus Dehalobacter alkaniphilus]